MCTYMHALYMSLLPEMCSTGLIHFLHILAETANFLAIVYLGRGRGGGRGGGREGGRRGREGGGEEGEGGGREKGLKAGCELI